MLDLAQILAYIVALGVAAAIPGPGITALVARTVANGPTAGFAMLGGLIIGDLIYLSLAVFGLAVIAKTFALVFVVIKWFSILFLCYLAWQFWTASHQDLTMNTPEKRRLFPVLISGLTLTLGNPKTIAFYLALLPLVIDLEKVAFATWLYVLAPLTVLVLLAVGGVYIVGAISVRRFLSSHKAQKTMHRSAAIAMAGAAGTMAARGL